ncbi:hypothetical protein EBR43_04605 [bacterium]|nr:hypothetical protein [bacterium]NBW57058.1 hypothetical protein [bacterium]NBX71874.1 hypothetical protein [bacterium]
MDATGTFFSMIGQVVATSVEASRASDPVVARDRWVVVDDEVTPPTFEAQILAGRGVRVDPELLQYLSEKTDMPIFAEPVDQGAFFHLSVGGDRSDIDDRRLKMVAEQLGIPTLIRKVPSDFF